MWSKILPDEFKRWVTTKRDGRIQWVGEMFFDHALEDAENLDLCKFAARMLRKAGVRARAVRIPETAGPGGYPERYLLILPTWDNLTPEERLEIGAKRKFLEEIRTGQTNPSVVARRYSESAWSKLLQQFGELGGHVRVLKSHASLSMNVYALFLSDGTEFAGQPRGKEIRVALAALCDDAGSGVGG